MNFRVETLIKQNSQFYKNFTKLIWEFLWISKTKLYIYKILIKLYLIELNIKLWVCDNRIKMLEYL